MAAYAEGLNVLHNADIGKRQQDVHAETAPLLDPQYYQYHLNLPEIAELWRRGSVIGSWLARSHCDGAFESSSDLANFSGHVSRFRRRALDHCRRHRRSGAHAGA